MSVALAPFFSSFFILLREGFEAMLIAVLVFMYLDKVKVKLIVQKIFLNSLKNS